MNLSIIVPVYNEEKLIRDNLLKIINYFESRDLLYEIIVVDDGSSDRTRDAVMSLNHGAILLTEKRLNRGKGFSVRQGVLMSRGEYIFFTDADLSAPIEEFAKLMKYAEDYDIVIGSRALDVSLVKTSFSKKILGRIGNSAIKLLAVRHISDTQCGFKLFNKKAGKLFKKQKIHGFGFDFEILFLAQKNNMAIKEVPVKWVIGESTKVGLVDYLIVLSELVKLKVNYLKGDYKD